MTHRMFQWAPDRRQIAKEAPWNFVISSSLPVLPLRLAWVRQALSQRMEWDLTGTALLRSPRLTHNSSRSLPHIQQGSRKPLSDSRNVPRDSSPASICGTHVGGPAVPGAPRHGAPPPPERTKMTHRVFEWAPERQNTPKHEYLTGVFWTVAM